MNQTFPFNLPGPTAWYAVLYVLTLLLHAVFMSYVLAGCIMLGIAGLRGMLGRKEKPSVWAPVTTVLKDWMPFALSAAITAGIAPLLFVQILYQQEFYTANLLSFHRWMAILPVLIIAFYLLYLLKAHRIEGRTAVQGVVAMIVMGCMLFVAWSWAENHLLSIDREAWAGQYQSRLMLYPNPSIIPRLAFWVMAAFPTAGLLLVWQTLSGASGVSHRDAEGSARALAWLCVITSVIATLAAIPVLNSTRPGTQFSWNRTDMLLWGAVLLTGAISQWAVWIAVITRRLLSTSLLLIGSFGVVLFWLGILSMREANRLAVLASPALFARHERVGTIAGLSVFLIFALIGVGTIIWIVRVVSHALRTSTTASPLEKN